MTTFAQRSHICWSLTKPPKLGSNHHRCMSHHFNRLKVVQEVQELPGCFLLVVSPRRACRVRPVELRPPVEICSTGLTCHDTTSCSPIQKCKLHSTSLAGLRRGSRTTAVRNFRSDRVLPCGTLTERAKQQNSGAPFYLLGPPSPCLASQYNLPPASRHALTDRSGEARVT